MSSKYCMLLHASVKKEKEIFILKRKTKDKEVVVLTTS